MDIPGYEQLKFKVRLLNKTRMIYPQKEGTYVTLLPDQAFISYWDPDAYWSDQILKMTISTKTTNGLFTDTLEFANYAAVRFNPDYNGGPVSKSSFTYGNFLSLLNRNLSCGSDIVWHRILDFSIQINTSDYYFPILPIEELNLNPYDILQRNAQGSLTALGIATSKVSIKVSGLKFDYATIVYMIQDTLLRKFRLVY
jgi:hypothetical protein